MENKFLKITKLTARFNLNFFKIPSYNKVTEANLGDSRLASGIIKRKKELQHVKKIWGDIGCLGKKTSLLVESYHRTLEIIRPPRKYFCILDDAFAWLEKHRLLIEDYKHLCTASNFF